MTIALVVGRFQPLHIGHLLLFNYCEENYSDVTVVLGKSPEGRTKRNPLSVSERKDLVKTVSTSFTICSATEDFTGGFTQNVIENINNPVSKYTLISLNDTTIDELSPRFDFKRPFIPILCRGSEIRERIVKGKEWKKYVSDDVYQLLKEIEFEEKVKNTQKS